MPPDTTLLTLPSSYKACSAFTRVAACTLALSPIRDTLIEGFSHFVTSMTAPIASGWSGCRVGLAPTGKCRLFTALTRNGHRPESKTLNGDVRSQSAPEHLLRSSATSLSSSSTTCGGNCSEAGHLHEFFGIPRSLNLNRRRRILNFSLVVGGELQ